MRGKDWIGLGVLALAAAAAATIGWRALRPPAPPPPAPANFGRVDQAVAEFIGRVLARTDADRRNPQQWFTLGKTYDANDYDDLAVACYDQAQALGQNEPELFFHRAAVEGRLGRLEQAVADMRRAAAQAPTFAPAHWRLGLLLFEQGNLVEAQSAFLQAVRIDRLDSCGWIGLAKVMLQLGEYQRAADLLNEMLQSVRTNQGYAFQLLGVAYRGLGRTDEAEAATLRGQGIEPAWTDPWRDGLVQYSPSHKSRLAQGKQFLNEGKTDQAIEILELLYKDWPEEPSVGTSLGMAYGLRGRPDDAIKVLESVVAAHPMFGAAHLNLAAALHGKSEQLNKTGPGGPGSPGATDDPPEVTALREQAIIHVDKALELSPSLGRAYGLKAELLAGLGRPAEAVRSYEEALRYEPANVEWMRRSAVLRFNLGQFEDAAHEFEQVTKRQPAAADAFYGLGLSFQRLGRLAESEAAIAQALKLRPGDAQFESGLRDVQAQRAAPPRP